MSIDLAARLAEAAEGVERACRCYLTMSNDPESDVVEETNAVAEAAMAFVDARRAARGFRTAHFRAKQQVTLLGSGARRDILADDLVADSHRGGKLGCARIRVGLDREEAQPDSGDAETRIIPRQGSEIEGARMRVHGLALGACRR